MELGSKDKDDLVKFCIGVLGIKRYEKIYKEILGK